MNFSSAAEMEPFKITSGDKLSALKNVHVQAFEKKEVNREFKVYQNVQHHHVVKQERRVLDSHDRLFARSPGLDILDGKALIDRFPPMRLGASSPGGMVVNHHEAEFKQVVVKDGKVVKYEHMKMKK